MHRFPSSFGSIASFHKALASELDIHVDLKELTSLLRRNLHYQTQVIRPRKFASRKLYSVGVGIQGLVDCAYIHFKSESSTKVFVFLLVLDVTSRFAYTRALPKTSPGEIKKAFLHLFRNEKMPRFPILRYDTDLAFKPLPKFFSKKHMLLKPKRGPNHLHVLEPVVRVLKSKIVKFIRQNTDLGLSNRNLAKVLKDATASFNDSVNSAGFAPSSVNSEFFDPFLRQILYPNHRVEKFDVFYTEQLKRQTKANSPDQKALNEASQKPDNYRVGDMVYIDWKTDRMNRSYKVRRGNVYRVARVNTISKPYLYLLEDIFGRPREGYFYGRELTRALDADLKIDKVLKRKTDSRGQKMALVSFQGYNESFNRWINLDNL